MYRKPLEDPRKNQRKPQGTPQEKNIEMYRTPLENPRKTKENHRENLKKKT